MIRAYLAGPDVFRDDARLIFVDKKRIALEYGIKAISPLDTEITTIGKKAALEIKKTNCLLIRGVDVVIADMSPFRGPGMDGGTAFEMGFADAIGIPIFGYSSDHSQYIQKVIGSSSILRAMSDGSLRDASGLKIEEFGFEDNLMMSCSVTGNIVDTFQEACYRAIIWYSTSNRSTNLSQ